MNDKSLIHVDFNEEKKPFIKILVKKIICPFLRIGYSILMNIYYPHDIDEKKYNVSVCSIFRDEGSYLKEWIEFHKIVGVEHFYLYNNKSNDNYLEVLKPYIDNGYVTLVDWPKPQSQMEAFLDCANKYSSETKWIAFIDLDEFIVPNEKDDIYSLLHRFEKNRPVVIGYWKYFGSSGIVNREIKGLVSEDFILGWEKYADLGKVFFNTKYTYAPEHRGSNYMHAMWAKYKNVSLPPVNFFNKVCIYGENPIKRENMPLQINHYLLKSYMEFIDRKSKRGGGVHGIGFHDEQYFEWHDGKSTVPDYKIFKYMIRLKKAMDNPLEM